MFSMIWHGTLNYDNIYGLRNMTCLLYSVHCVQLFILDQGKRRKTKDRIHVSCRIYSVEYVNYIAQVVKKFCFNIFVLCDQR